MCEAVNDPCFGIGAAKTSLPAHLSFGQFLLNRLRTFKGKEIALVNSISGESVSYKQLLEYSINLSASLFKLGIKKGETVAVCSEKRNETLPIAFAIIMTGATYTPIYAYCGTSVLVHNLELTKPTFLISSGTFWKKNADTLKTLRFIETFISSDDTPDPDLIPLSSLMKNAIDLDLFESAQVNVTNDVPLILYSSGTTGLPKGVLLHHAACIMNSLESDFKETVKTVWVYGDWYHNYDFFITISNLCCGRTVVWYGLDAVEAEPILKAVNDYRVDIVVTVPSIVIALAEAELNLIEKYANSLKVIYSSAAQLASNVIKLCNIKYPKATVFQSYGMTEVGPVTSETLSVLGPKPGSVGVVFPGVMLKVVDVHTREVLGQGQVGELCVRSPAIMKGYIKTPSHNITDMDGFFSTGDLAYYDEDRFLFIVDRIKEIINYDGYKVAPLQLETILLSHPDVCDAGVVGKPDAVFNELPTAFVVRRPGSKVTENELEAFIAAEVCDFMQLRGGVNFVSEIPRNPMRKILRRHLRELCIN